MGKWAAGLLAGLLATWVLTGCSASPSAFQGVVAVAGEWQFRTTTTGVIPGATVPPFSIPTVGMVTTGQWRLSQNNRSVSGEGVNGATGVTFPLLGQLDGGSLILESLGSNPRCGTVRVRLNLRLNGEGTELQGTGVTEVGGCFRSQEAIVATRIL